MAYLAVLRIIENQRFYGIFTGSFLLIHFVICDIFGIGEIYGNTNKTNPTNRCQRQKNR